MRISLHVLRPFTIPQPGLLMNGPGASDRCLRALALLWPQHRRKRIAVWFGVTVETAKTWLRDGMPYSRRAQLADAIEAEIPRLEREIDELEAIEAELRRGAHVEHVAHRARLLAGAPA